ncbi:WD repeat-containing protein on Y chromosome, partial [Frankliniella fusca]
MSTVNDNMLSSVGTTSSGATGGTGGSLASRRSPRVRRKATRVKQDGKEKVVLASKLDKDQIEAIHDLFKEFELTKLRQDELRDLLRDFNITMNDEDFHCKQKSPSQKSPSKCRQMDSNRSGSITWDEVVSHLMVELAESTGGSGGRGGGGGGGGGSGAGGGDPSPTTELLTDPINALPEIIRSPHRNPILRITYWPEVSPDRSFNYLQGSFVSASHDGAVQYWSMDMRRSRLVQSKTVLLRVRPTRVTDLVCMPDVNMLCTSSTERELRFYDSRAARWELRVSGLDRPVVTMYYRMSELEHEESTLILGDTGGSIRTLNFTSVMCGPFKQHVGKEVTHVVFKDLCKGALPGLRVVHFPGVHTNWVRQVYFYASLQSIVSCAACPRPSLFMCDAAGTKNQYNYDIPSGAYCFCASE